MNPVIRRMKYDQPISVVGGGPAGLAAALALCKSGRRVILYDRRPDHELAFPTSWRILDNWSGTRPVIELLTSIGAKLDFELIPVREITVHGPNDETAILRAENPLAHLARWGGKHGLDASLRDRARQVGTEIRRNVPALLEGDAPSILATGPRTVDGIRRGCTFAATGPNGIHIFLDDRLAPKGNVILVNQGGEATLTVILFDRFEESAENFQRVLRHGVAAAGVRVESAPEYFGDVLSYSIPGKWKSGKNLLVGAAGGFGDCLFGLGTSMAMESGVLAADAIAYGYDYAIGCAEVLMPRVRAGIANRLMFGQLGNLGYADLIDRLPSGDALHALKQLYSPTEWRDTIFSIAIGQLHPILFREPCESVSCECIRCQQRRHIDLDSYRERADAANS